MGDSEDLDTPLRGARMGVRVFEERRQRLHGVAWEGDTSMPFNESIAMKQVMFVCRRNSCRSQMAEGFAKALGEGKIRVTSSGLESSRVHPTAIEVMSEIGIDIHSQTSDPLSDFEPENYDAVVSLCGCGVNLPTDWVMRELFEDWELEDPDGQPLETFRRVRDEIRGRVQTLIDKLSD